MSAQVLTEGRDIPGPQQVGIHKSVHAGSRRVLFRALRAHDGVGGEINARPRHFANIELVNATRMHERNLNLEATVGRAKVLDFFGGAKRPLAKCRKQSWTRIAIRGGAAKAPIPGLCHVRSALIIEQPRVRVVVEVRKSVVCEANALAKLDAARAVANLVVDDARTLPEANEPRHWRKFGWPGGVELNHEGVQLALAAKEVVDHNNRHVADRQRREAEKANEEELKCEKHVLILSLCSPAALNESENGRGCCHNNEGTDHAGGRSGDKSIFAMNKQLNDERQDDAGRENNGQPRDSRLWLGDRSNDQYANKTQQPHGHNAPFLPSHAFIVPRTGRTRGRHESAAAHGRILFTQWGGHMAHILMLSSAPDAEPLPSLGLLSHTVEVVVAAPATLVAAPTTDLIMVDATTNLAAAKGVCGVLHSGGISVPLFAIVTDGGLAAVNHQWHVDDLLVVGAGPAEIDARIRLAMARREGESSASKIRASGIVIDEASYSAKARDRSLDLTFKEFELLRFLASHPGHVFTREQLLSEVWGYDYFGGTRTVDVHVRRLRAKLGDLESLIGTVRNVGYCFNIAEEPEKTPPAQATPASTTASADAEVESLSASIAV